MEQDQAAPPFPPQGEGEPLWLKRYAHLTVDAAVELARAEGRRIRIIQPGSDVTLDFVPSRVNLWIGPHGEIDHVDGG